MESKLFERFLVEIMSCPSLEYEAVLVSTFSIVLFNTYLYSVQWSILVHLNNTGLTTQLTATRAISAFENSRLDIASTTERVFEIVA